MSALADVPDGVLVLAEWHLRGGMPGWHDDEPTVGRTWPWRLRIDGGVALAWMGSGSIPPVVAFGLDDVRRELGRRLFGGWGAAREDGQ